jgi:hypothetical protein
MALNWLIAMIIAVSAVANTTTSTAKPGCRDVPCLDFDLNEAEARYAACLLKGESMGYHIGSVSVWWFCSHELNDVLKECTSESPPCTITAIIFRVGSKRNFVQNVSRQSSNLRIQNFFRFDL